jgi:hypothetical protein
MKIMRLRAEYDVGEDGSMRVGLTRIHPAFAASAAIVLVAAAVAVPLAIGGAGAGARASAGSGTGDSTLTSAGYGAGTAGLGTLITPAGLPSKQQQIQVLTAALAKMAKQSTNPQENSPGPVDIDDYGIGSLWRQGIDGAGATIAVIEGWNDPHIAQVVAAFDKPLGLPNPQIQTIYPAGALPKNCPAGMVKLGGYGSCAAW